MNLSYEWILEAQGINKSFTRGMDELHILKGLDLKVRHGESVSIVGPSGSGKSTLLQILGTLDRPSSGSLEIMGHDVLSIDDHALAKYRNEKMGFVFQFHHLLSEFDALENVALPLRIAGQSKKEALEKAEHWLKIVGLQDRFKHFPNQLSGGELQRVAIARALVRQPRILFADEPTGNLDSKNSRSIQDLFFSLRDQLKLTLIVVTHDLSFAEKFSRAMKLADGQWVGG